MKGTVRIDHLNKNIYVSSAFAKASMRITTEEYKTLLTIKASHPDYTIIKREIKKNPQKESYRGLTYEYMENYIQTHDKGGTVMEQYRELILRTKCHSIRYAHVKKWFLELYPEIDDFTCKRTVSRNGKIVA